MIACVTAQSRFVQLVISAQLIGQIQRLWSGPWGKTLADNRVNQVCLFLSATSITRDAHGLYRLLATWGGEGIYWRHAGIGNTLGDRLRSLGLPTIVVAQLDLTVPTKPLVFPGIANAFVGTALRLTDIGSDIFYFAPVSPAGIERLIQPGDRDYPQHSDIPQK
jgi:hypothetical protein